MESGRSNWKLWKWPLEASRRRNRREPVQLPIIKDVAPFVRSEYGLSIWNPGCPVRVFSLGIGNFDRFQSAPCRTISTVVREHASSAFYRTGSTPCSWTCLGWFFAVDVVFVHFLRIWMGDCIDRNRLDPDAVALASLVCGNSDTAGDQSFAVVWSGRLLTGRVCDLRDVSDFIELKDVY